MHFDLLFFPEVYMPLFSMIIFLPLFKNSNKGSVSVFIYCSINLIFILFANILAKLDINNIMLYHVLTLVDVLFACFYILKLSMLKKFVFMYASLAAAFTIFWVANVYLIEPLHVFNRISATVGGIFILILSGHYMVFLITSKQVIYFYKMASFWIVSGFLFNSLLYIVLMLLLIPLGNQSLLFIDEEIAVIVKFSFISIGFINCYKQMPFSKENVVQQ